MKFFRSPLGRRRLPNNGGGGGQHHFSSPSMELIALFTVTALAALALQMADAQLATDEKENCFARVDEAEWPAQEVLRFNASEAAVVFDLRGASRGLRECLEADGRAYQVVILRDGRVFGAAELDSSSGEEGNSTAAAVTRFAYAVLPGVYSARLKCDGCSEEVTSHPVNVVGEDCDAVRVPPSVAVEQQEMLVFKSTASFVADFSPDCESALASVPYLSASISLYHHDPESGDARCGANSSRLVESSVARFSPPGGVAFRYTVPWRAVEGANRWYCIVARFNGSDDACDGWAEAAETNGGGGGEERAGGTDTIFCREVVSEAVYIESLPLVARLIPYCSSHIKCGWLYIVVAFSAVFVFSCLCAVCCVYCCCRCCCANRRRRKLHRGSPRDETIPFEGLPQSPHTAIKPKKTWAELHTEWDVEPPKNPGKILLLYSPDTDGFKELQSAFRGFLEQACHCIVLDFFDEELFQEIAYDPEAWLTKLLADPDFKVIVVCSEGAFKRQQSLLSGEVLNIPTSSSTFDGLFSAGLKFFQAKHAYDYDRLALSRYEMLPLCAEEYRLVEMVPNREFLVPTQLHDVFCWIHGYDPLDLLGKPWDRYHLELQLLQDALKVARKERRKME